MHAGAYAVTHKLTHHAVAMVVRALFHRGAYVRNVVSGNSLLHSAEEAFPCHFNKLLHFVLNVAYQYGAGRVAMVAIQYGAHVYADYIPILQLITARDAVYHLFVHACADTLGIALVVKEAWYCALRADKIFGDLVQLLGRHANRRAFFKQQQRVPYHRARSTHQFNFALTLYRNAFAHFSLSVAATTSA